MITANTDGTISHWNTKMGIKINSFKEEEENEVYCIDLNAKETLFATIGKDCKVRRQKEINCCRYVFMMRIQFNLRKQCKLLNGLVLDTTTEFFRSNSFLMMQIFFYLVVGIKQSTFGFTNFIILLY
jgi:WD40 repeat protein